MRSVFIVLVSGFLMSCVSLGNLERQYQNDADIIRLEHLQYWTALVEEYNQKSGQYPFQNMLQTEKEIGLVKIATKQQRQYLSPGTPKYNSKFDNNVNKRFTEYSVKKFILELENVLGRTIDEKYDIQKVPTSSPVGYFYFVTSDGYLFWVTCITCGVTHISTLLMDGFTPTVNIVSEGMKGNVTKALTRDEMISHSTFKNWIKRKPYREEYVRQLVKENINDSKD